MAQQSKQYNKITMRSVLVRWGSLWHLPAFAVLFPVLEAFLLSSAYWMVGPITPDPWWEGKRVTSYAPLARTEFLAGRRWWR